MMRLLLYISLLFCYTLPSLARENYTLPSPPSGTTTLLDYISSNSNLSSLNAAIKLAPGFEAAFSQAPAPKTNITFFAPNNAAFDSLSQNLKRFWLSPSTRGRAYWAGVLLYHYVPFDAINTTALFTDELRKLMMGNFLYLGTQMRNDGEGLLNRRVKIVEGNIPITGGYIHIIDGILDPTGLFFDNEYAVPSIKQTTISGWSLPY